MEPSTVTAIIWSLFYLHVIWYCFDGIMCYTNPGNWIGNGMGLNCGKDVSKGVAEFFTRVCGGLLLTINIILLIVIDPINRPMESLVQILPNVFVGGYAIYSNITNRYMYDKEMYTAIKGIVPFHLSLMTIIVTRVYLAMYYL